MENQCKYTVCIHCMTYNHEKYLADALEGFVMQETNFPFVAVVIDDFSTDGTADILRKYEAKYPDIIKAVYLQENYYSQRKSKKPFLAPYDSQAKYIAMCEGDDYWTDPYKLQKQVDFMENHPDYSVCFCRCMNCLWKENKKMVRDTACDKWLQPNDVGVDISLSMFFKSWITQPLTMMWRASMYDANWAKNPKYSSFRDTYMIYHLLRAGKGYLMNFFCGVYNSTGYGVASSLGTISSCQFELQSADEIYGANKEPNAQQYWRDTVLWSLNTYNEQNRTDLYWALIGRELKQFPIDTLFVLNIIYKRKIKKLFKK